MTQAPGLNIASVSDSLFETYVQASSRSFCRSRRTPRRGRESLRVLFSTIVTPDGPNGSRRAMTGLPNAVVSQVA